MLSYEQASKVISKTIPGDIKSAILYNGVYIFQVIDSSNELDGEFDPFYSVDAFSGKVSDFSIITDIDISEYMKLVEESNLVK